MSKRESLPSGPYEPVALLRERAAELATALRDAYPDAKCALDFDTPFQLLIATILSAQCTDARVNMVTPALFDAYPDAHTMANARLEHLEELVKPTGFYRQKAKNLLAGAQLLVDEYDGVVPHEIDKLVRVPGAARKTANVVISNCFPEHAAGIAVDTHVQRIVRRLKLVRSWEPVKIERELMKVFERSEWNQLTHLMIDHGRAVCKAPRPKCSQCPMSIASQCPSLGRWGE